MFGGTVVIFALGVAWLSIFLNDFQAALANGFSPFIIGGFVKIALAAAVLPLVWKLAIGKRSV
jgi:biotin transport system substrate-specific component